MMPLVTSIQSIFPAPTDLFDVIYNATAAFVHQHDVKKLFGPPWDPYAECIRSLLPSIAQEDLDEFLL